MIILLLETCVVLRIKIPHCVPLRYYHEVYRAGKVFEILFVFDDELQLQSLLAAFQEVNYIMNLFIYINCAVEVWRNSTKIT